MNNELLKMLGASAVRHGLTALSVLLVQKQLLSADHSGAFVDNLTTYALDALPALIALLWSAVQKSDAHDALSQVQQ